MNELSHFYFINYFVFSLFISSLLVIIRSLYIGEVLLLRLFEELFKLIFEFGYNYPFDEESSTLISIFLLEYNVLDLSLISVIASPIRISIDVWI